MIRLKMEITDQIKFKEPMQTEKFDEKSKETLTCWKILMNLDIKRYIKYNA